MSATGNTESREVLFKERQTFQQVWVRILIIGLSGFLIVWSLYFIYEQFILNVPVGNKPLSDTGAIISLVLTLGFGIGLPLLFSRTNLLVTVDREALQISFSPFTHRTIPIQSIIHCEPRTIELLREYGGIGVRFSFRGGGIAYIVNGNDGVQIELDNGKRLFVGSQHPEELAQALAIARSQ
jgi:hypothetical protein